MESGVYHIVNNVTKKKYIGSAFDLQGRFKRHIKALSNNTHYNKHLQASYNKYGSESFIFEIISNCPQEYVKKLEQLYLDNSNWDFLYNISKTTEFGGSSSVSEGSKEKLRARGKLLVGPLNPFYGKKHSKETKKKISDARKAGPKGKDHPNYGQKRTEDTKRRIGAASKGRSLGKKKSEESVKRTADASRKRWATEEYRAKMALIKVGVKKKLMKPVLEFDLKGLLIREFEGVELAQKFHKISGTKLNAIFRGDETTKFGTILRRKSDIDVA